MSWWNDSGAVVWSVCDCDDCDDCDNGYVNYGPHRREVRDPTHHALNELRVTAGGFRLMECACGWVNFDYLWPTHLDDVAPMHTVYS